MPLEDGVPEVQPLTDAQKAVINATAPVLAEHGFTITKRFCARSFLPLFEADTYQQISRCFAPIPSYEKSSRRARRRCAGSEAVQGARAHDRRTTRPWYSRKRSTRTP